MASVSDHTALANPRRLAQIHRFDRKDAVFGFGGRGQGGFIRCTELKDERLLWKQTGDEWSKDQQLIIADGLLLALTKNEELVMANASREGYFELGRLKLNMELGRPQHPTIANGRMYIRGNEEVACYRIAAPGAG